MKIPKEHHSRIIYSNERSEITVINVFTPRAVIAIIEPMKLQTNPVAERAISGLFPVLMEDRL